MIDFDKWLQRPFSTPVHLIEFTGGGLDPVYIGSVPFVTKPDDVLANIAFVDLLVERIEFSADIDHNIEISKLQIFGTDPARYENRDVVIKLGGIDWDYDDFQFIANGKTSIAIRDSDVSLTVEFVDRLNDLDTIITSNSSFSGTILDVVTAIVAQIGWTPPALIGFDESQSSALVTLEVGDNRNMLSSIRSICASVGAFPRTNLVGQFEIVSPYGVQLETITIGLDDLTELSELDSVEAKDVELEWLNGSVFVNNSVGKIEKRDTLINNAADAQAESTRVGGLRSVRRRVWRADVTLQAARVMLGSKLQASDDLVADRSLVSNTGIVIRYRKILSDKRVEIEVLQ